MLVLTRKPQEKIRIGDAIVITVLRTKGKAVSLGIEAPDDVPVVRGELTFQSPPTDDEGSEENHPARPGARRLRREANVPRTNANWPTDASERATRSMSSGEAATAVSMRRVPRSEVAEVLPRLVTAGPLRTMLDQRSATR